VVAFLLLTASVLIGLSMALRIAPRRQTAAIRAGHERIALAALAAIAAHGLLLLGDPWLHPGLVGLIVPFAMGYRTVWTGLGVCAGYLAATLSLSYYARARLGARRWRRAHRFIPIAWALSVAHVIGSGTDGGETWLLAPTVLAAATVVLMLGYRLGRPRRVTRPLSA
jgi:methionine sulfoxide reductase heme-binding subunit